jgi:hypothetical protein
MVATVTRPRGRRTDQETVPPTALPEEELRWLEGFVTDPRLPGGTWHQAVYSKPTDTLGEGAPAALWGVWSDAGGAASPNDPGPSSWAWRRRTGRRGRRWPTSCSWRTSICPG